MQNALVSVLMPCYNEEKYLALAVESIVQQTYQEWELILVDDGSDERTRSVIEECKNKDER